MDRAHWEKLKERTDDARKVRDERRDRLRATPEYAAMIAAWAYFIEASRTQSRGYRKLSTAVKVRLEREREAEREMTEAEVSEAAEHIEKSESE